MLKTLWEYLEELYANKFENLNETQKFLGKYGLPKVS